MVSGVFIVRPWKNILVAFNVGTFGYQSGYRKSSAIIGTNLLGTLYAGVVPIHEVPYPINIAGNVPQAVPR